jgi:hypothetical protein
MNCARGLVFALLLSAAWGLRAYELPNHYDMSLAAAQKSIVGQGGLADLGLDDPSKQFPTTVDANDPGFSDKCLHGGLFDMLSLIACGAEFEDVPSSRSLNHFFDPQNLVSVKNANGQSYQTGRPLTIPLFSNLPNPPTPQPSPSWSLEDKGEIPGQDFSYKDARRQFYFALTSSASADRDAAWGRTFQTLGQVIHHLQDMAQPQHVRNEPHCDQIIPCALGNLYSPSRYEKYSNTGLTVSGASGRTQVGSLAFNADGNAVYPGPNNANISVFDTPRKFFTLVGDKGIADFTSKNFLSQGTVFTSNNGFVGPAAEYSNPVPEASANVPVTQAFPNGVPDSVLAACGPDPSQCFMTFYRTIGVDPLTGSLFTNDRAATSSIFDQDLNATVALQTATGTLYRTDKVFALNALDFDAAQQFLIPRAVSYSAGMLNYFFRGKLDYVDDPLLAGGKRIRNLSQETMTGTFAFYYDAVDGNRYVVPNAIWNNVTLPPYDATITDPNNPAFGFAANITAPVDPAPKVPGVYMLVFSGSLGAETADASNDVPGAVAGKLVKLFSGFLVQPSYPPRDNIGGQRLITYGFNGWQLSPIAGLVAGGVDWKGQYVNGTPTRTLSWNGPTSRYFFGSTQFGTAVYKGGEVLAVAPYAVLGAAIATDAGGVESVVVIARGFSGDYHIYRRPATKSASAALYDPLNAPSGWRELGNFQLDGPYDASWFFNGTGTEAQTVRLDATRGSLVRYKVSIQGDTASLANLGNDAGVSLTITETGSAECTMVNGQCADQASGQSTRTFSGQGTYVVAVDYQDQQEVVARVEAPSGGFATYEYSGDSFSYSADHQAWARLSFTGGTIPLTGRRVQQAAQPAGIGNLTVTTVNTSLRFMDLRYGVAVFEQTTAVDQWTATGTACPGNAQRLHQLMIVAPRQSTTTDLDPPTNTDITSTLASCLVFNGYETIPPSPNASISVVIDPGTPSPYIVSANDNGVAASVDRNGRFAGSFVYGSSFNPKWFSTLTDGSLQQAIPVAPSDAAYYSIGVVE